MARIVSALYDDQVAQHPSQTAPATGRDRIRAYAHENGFVAADSSPWSNIDEFVRGDRIVHIKYGLDERIVDILVNGRCLYNRDRSLATHRRRIAAYEARIDRLIE
jgi:hypothetical protein